MATLSMFILKVAGRNAKSQLRPKSFNVYSSRSYASQEGVQTSENETTDSPLDEEQATRIDQVQNVSRLSSNHYKQYHGQPPDLAYKDLYRRKMLYAQFGVSSGEDPRILWPPRVKLLDLEQEEKEEGSPLHDRLAQIQAVKDEEEKAKIDRRNEIEQSMNQMPKWMEEYKKKHRIVEKVAKERKAKKDDLLEEARDYYGYKIQANDPKFRQMVEDKELKEKTEMKKRKKEEKKLKISQLHQNHSEVQIE